MPDGRSPSGGWRAVYAEMGVSTRAEADARAAPVRRADGQGPATRGASTAGAGGPTAGDAGGGADDRTGDDENGAGEAGDEADDAGVATRVGVVRE